MNPIDRVARRFLASQLRRSVEKNPLVKGRSLAIKTVNALLPGLGRDMQVEIKGFPRYSFDGPEDFGLLRFKLTSTQFMGISPETEIPFQIGWSNSHKQYKATSFKAELAFRSMASLTSFMGNAGKIKTLINKGLKSLDPGEAAFYGGKLTPEAVVNRVLGVTASFEAIDEWHSTSMSITLMLRTAKKVSSKLIEAWLKTHWSEVLAKAPSKTPRPAGAPSRYASWDDDEYDDEYDDEWMMDYPAEGLGWLVPNRMSFNELEGIDVKQDKRRAVVYVHAAIRGS